MARAWCAAHVAALKQRNTRLTASSRTISRTAAERCGHTRASSLQRGEMRHARTHHVRTIK
eukprot:2437833-Lingulodinium_polyedra.AAC.1